MPDPYEPKALINALHGPSQEAKDEELAIALVDHLKAQISEIEAAIQNAGGNPMLVQSLTDKCQNLLTQITIARTSINPRVRLGVALLIRRMASTLRVTDDESAVQIRANKAEYKQGDKYVGVGQAVEILEKKIAEDMRLLLVAIDQAAEERNKNEAKPTENELGNIFSNIKNAVLEVSVGHILDGTSKDIGGQAEGKSNYKSGFSSARDQVVALLKALKIGAVKVESSLELELKKIAGDITDFVTAQGRDRALEDELEEAAREAMEDAIEQQKTTQVTNLNFDISAEKIEESRTPDMQNHSGDKVIGMGIIDTLNDKVALNPVEEQISSKDKNGMLTPDATPYVNQVAAGKGGGIGM